MKMCMQNQLLKGDDRMNQKLCKFFLISIHLNFVSCFVHVKTSLLRRNLGGDKGD